MTNIIFYLKIQTMALLVIESPSRAGFLGYPHGGLFKQPYKTKLTYFNYAN